MQGCKAADKGAPTADKKASTKERKTVDENKDHGKKSSPSYKSFEEVNGEFENHRQAKALEKSTEIMNKLDEEIYETIDKAGRPGFRIWQISIN